MSAGRWLTPTGGYLRGYTHTLNPYAGCAYGCSYCYVRRLPVALFRGEPWGTWAEPKRGEPETVRRELRRVRNKGPVAVFLSSATDPYQPLEAKAKLTRRLLEAMADEPPDFLLVQTRSPLVLRDADLFRAWPEERLRVSITVETDREDVRKALTPGAPPLAARLRAIRTLRRAGIDVQAAVSPLLPHTPDFPRLLADTAPRVVVDDYFRGDGSGGRRSEQLGLRAQYASLGLASWYAPEAADGLFSRLRALLPEGAALFSAEGFAPPAYRPPASEAEDPDASIGVGSEPSGPPSTGL